ncbi:MAG: threonylcarbamoyl-AMP synthase [Gemmatimonadetes bacterium]|nr:threonylcarbamoyl-AMP synthase [Gemmatimonadota bacterium]
MSGGPIRLDLRGTEPDADALAPVALHLRGGGLAAYPTETVYGFGCALHGEALEALAHLKRREGHKPFLLLVSDASAVPALAWTDEARELARIFWPGSLTLVLADPDATFPEAVRSAAGGVAVRVSAHPVARTLTSLLDGPLTSTSANAPGMAPAGHGEAAMAAARALGADERMWVLDAGALPPSPSSTIVDCTGPTPAVLREGATPLARLRCVLPGIDGH